LKTKKSLELLSEMSECQGNPSQGLSKNNFFNSLFNKLKVFFKALKIKKQLFKNMSKYLY